MFEVHAMYSQANDSFDVPTREQLNALRMAFGPVEILPTEDSDDWLVRIQLEGLEELPTGAIAETPLAAAQRLCDLLAPISQF